ncbi:TIM-barrel domain-containing protein [Motilibacter deserti]|uniref:TIM-barrel domain-containing protein n=1 Tax=Motilibacter deserti TaxID=2714956 RepID=UPI002F2B2704
MTAPPLPRPSRTVRPLRRPRRRARAGLLAVALAVGGTTLPLGASTASAALKTGYSASGSTLTVNVWADRAADSRGYSVEIDRATLRLTTKRLGKVVLQSADAASAATAAPSFDFRPTGSSGWVSATSVRSASWDGRALSVVANTSNPVYSLLLTLTPAQDRYALTAAVQGTGATQLAAHYDMNASGHWYGHGEASTPNNGPYTDQPWPLDSGTVLDEAFGPAAYEMTEPFWFTSKASGLFIDTTSTMTVSLGEAKDNVAGFAVTDGQPLRQTVFVEETPKQVYADYQEIAGTPQKSDAPDYQYQSTVWNSWAQFYTNVTQAGFLDWARQLHATGIPAHTFSLDDGWMSKYGDFTFNAKFPDPKAMVDEVHAMGYNFGLWVTLWLNNDSQNYQVARANGWLLKSASDPSQPCAVRWWNGNAGIVDLANPAARAWYESQLDGLMSSLGVNGFKFDTRFFDLGCAPYTSDLGMEDYQALGAELADKYDLQGMGIRVHWTGNQSRGFVTREIDKGTGWDSLQAGMHQLLALSTVGHPFVTSDMIGGSLGQAPPTKQVLVRWAQAAALTPLMYSSTAPTGVTDWTTGRQVAYDAETVQLYKAAVERHGDLSDYILAQVRRAVGTGEPIMKPLFWEFPEEQATYTLDDQWLLGDSLLAAPVLEQATSRDVYLPEGRWYDPYTGQTLRGERWVRDYPAPLSVTPMFVRERVAETQQLKDALSGLRQGAERR